MRHILISLLTLYVWTKQMIVASLCQYAKSVTIFLVCRFFFFKLIQLLSLLWFLFFFPCLYNLHHNITVNSHRLSTQQFSKLLSIYWNINKRIFPISSYIMDYIFHFNQTKLSLEQKLIRCLFSLSLKIHFKQIFARPPYTFKKNLKLELQ